MAYISIDKLWESEFDNMVFKKDKVRDININQIKLEVQDDCKKMKKRTTNSEPTDDSNVTNRAYLDEKIFKVDGHISLLEYNNFTDYNELEITTNLNYNTTNNL